MWYLTFLAISAGFGVGIAAVASAFGLGKATKSTVESMARQPEAAGDIQTAFVIGGALIEALTIYALLTALLLWLKMPGAGDVQTLIEAATG